MTTAQHLAELPAAISVEEAGRLLGISRALAYRAVKTGEIPAVRIQGRILVPTPRLLTMLGATREETGVAA